MSTQIPKTQKAIQVIKAGGPEVFALRDIPVPSPKDDEVLIKVQWTGVNYSDTYFRAGTYPKSYPYTVGLDVVGTLLSTPKSPPIPFSIPVGTTVYTPFGPSFTEYVVAPAARVGALPDGVDKKDGVSMASIGLTALMLAKESYPVKKGDWVLVRAAAGGVGLTLIQIVKYLGGHVIGTVSTPEKAEQVKNAGADLVLLSTDNSADNVQKIVEASNGGVHAVYDGVGKDSWEENFEVVRRKGSIVAFGLSSGPNPPLSTFKLFSKSLKIVGPSVFSTISTPEEYKDYMAELAEIVQKAGIKFAVHKEYELAPEDIGQAHTDIEGRGTIGKLLVHVSD